MFDNILLANLIKLCLSSHLIQKSIIILNTNFILIQNK